MKSITKLLVLFFLLALNTNVFSQSGEDMKVWMEYMTPGSVHEMIAKSDGEWSEELTFWMDPTSPPIKSTATATNKMIMGGRYQQSTVTGNMMGMPFEGINILGYDNGRKVFQSTWIDNFGTGISNSEGTWDEASRTITLTGTSFDPAVGKVINIKQTLKIIDDNNQVMEMFSNESGTDVKTMEIKMTRK